MAMLGQPSGSTHLRPPNNRSLTQGCRSAAVLPPEAVANLENSPSILPRRLSLQRVKMATAKFKSHFHAPHGHHLFRSNSSNSVYDKPIDEEQKQKEKDFIACFECNGEPLEPSEIAEHPRNKEVGAPSKQLRVGDFQLIKTIGTGTYTYFAAFNLHVTASQADNLSGTFARVWLSCLADSSKEGQKCFALKILKKVDSKRSWQIHLLCLEDLNSYYSHPIEADRTYQE